MGRQSFENYGLLASLGRSRTEVAGRYDMQDVAERRIVPDVLTKLELNADDDLLEIGCGAGNLLVPLSFLTASATGIDHQDLLRVIEREHPGARICKISGNFLDIELNPEQSFSKILIYSVLHCLADEAEAINFVTKALSLLRPGGRMLIGDIPNADRKSRFKNSRRGSEFEAVWRKGVVEGERRDKIELRKDNEMLMPNDQMILTLMSELRARGANAYLVAQPNNLPFGHTREDIVVEKLS